jgi:hypothetical protein
VSADIDYPAWVQAGSAVVVTALTIVLAVATTKYARAASAANLMTKRTIERTQLAQAPRILVRAQQPVETTEGLQFRFLIKNVGVTAAADVSVNFDDDIWRPLTEPLPPKAEITMQVPASGPQSPNARAVRVRFRDPGGTLWKQEGDQYDLAQTPTRVDED